MISRIVVGCVFLICLSGEGASTTTELVNDAEKSIDTYGNNGGVENAKKLLLHVDALISNYASKSQLSHQEKEDLYSLADKLIKYDLFDLEVYRLLSLAPDKKYNPWLLHIVCSGSDPGWPNALLLLEQTVDNEVSIELLECALKYAQGQLHPQFDYGNSKIWEFLFVAQVKHGIDMPGLIAEEKGRLGKSLALSDENIEELQEIWSLLEAFEEIYNGKESGDRNKAVLMEYLRDNLNLSDSYTGEGSDYFILRRIFFPELIKRGLLSSKCPTSY